MTNQPQISIVPLFKKGIALTKSNFLNYLPIIIAAFAIVYFGTQGLKPYLLEQAPQATEFDLMVQSSAIVGLLISPLEVGLMLLGLSAARGERVNARDLKYVLKRSPQIIILTIITIALVQIGFMLVIPGLFLMIVLSMAPMLMCDKNINMFAAIKLSVTTLSKHWFILFVIYLWLILALLLSFFTMGIALIVTVPLYVNIKGLVYTILYDAPVTKDHDVAGKAKEFEA